MSMHGRLLAVLLTTAAVAAGQSAPAPGHVPSATPTPPSPGLPPDAAAGHVQLGEAGPNADCDQSWRTSAFAELLWGTAKDLGPVDYRWTPAFRGGLQHWFTTDRHVGLETTLFSLSDKATRIQGTPLAEDVALEFTTIDLNLRGHLFDHERVRIDGIVGYRYAGLEERLLTSTVAASALLKQRNNIHAGEVGLVGTYQVGPYFAEVLGKVGLGNNSRRTTRNVTDTTDSALSFIGEFGLRIGYQIGESTWFTYGYHAYYLSNVLRPTRGETDFFYHGLSVGLEFHF